ncbi:glycosyltransferase [Actinomadura sp. ATCC 31491]|uniref:Glycosyltransferase n=1 Tax=Actinomadura luzonensis TaxID=2805427 RepID=A0ABT0FWX5_9ACTN|nr:glycosyltransferase [Actinomadura luzonensis]MCK2216450.1 glycosyltransferase [Actinomadura luzonensis]
MITVVIPTIGRPTLARTIAAVGSGVPVVVVDDRPDPAGTQRRGSGTVGDGGGSQPREFGMPTVLRYLPAHVRLVRSGGKGPAAARNVGWRAADTPWVVFLDDDVIPEPGWADAVWKDLVDLPEDVAGSQGRIVVPLPGDRPPTDGERHTAGLSDASWVTADMAYRRAALAALGGFDERFPRAYREDADLALRMTRAGHRLVRGERVTRHPVRQDGFWASVRFQRGNADDALMRRLHGPGWRAAIGGGPGRLRIHAATTAAGLAAVTLGALAARVRGPRVPGTPARLVPALAAAAGAAWAGLTAEFAWRRIAPGPRTPDEVWRMAVTSVVIPPVACAHRMRGEWRVRR